MEGFLRPEFNKVSNGLSSRVADEGWLLVQKLLSQKDKLANLANCAQVRSAAPGQGEGEAGMRGRWRWVCGAGCAALRH